MHARTIVHTHTHIHMRMRKAKLAHSMNMRMTLANKTPDQLRTSAALLQLQSEFRKPAAFLYSQDACMHPCTYSCVEHRHQSILHHISALLLYGASLT